MKEKDSEKAEKAVLAKYPEATVEWSHDRGMFVIEDGQGGRLGEGVPSDEAWVSAARNMRYVEGLPTLETKLVSLRRRFPYEGWDISVGPTTMDPGQFACQVDNPSRDTVVGGTGATVEEAVDDALKNLVEYDKTANREDEREDADLLTAYTEETP